MKKIRCILMLALLCILSAGCGKEEAAVYYDIQVETDSFYDVSSSAEGRSNFLGTQFYQGEPVQFWALQAYPDDRADMYMYRIDVSRECLIVGVPEELLDTYFDSYCFVDKDGALYCFFLDLVKSGYGEGDVYRNISIKIDPSGAQAYRHEENGYLAVRDICQLPDGRIFVNYTESTNITGYRLGELDPGTGNITDVTSFVYDWSLWMGSGGDGVLLCMDGNGIFEVSLENGSKTNIWPFTGTTYITQSPRELWDFMITEEGELLLLWESVSRRSSAFLQTLRRVEVGAGKTPITMRGAEFVGDDGKWFKEMVSRFNQQSDTYYVVLEECGTQGDRDDYARQASVEVGAGKGPDIFYGDILGEYAYGIARKGGFADLGSYLEKAGIEEGDYFPCTFGRWRDGSEIYSVSLSVGLAGVDTGGYYIDAGLLGGERHPDITVLTDALLSQPDDGIFRAGTDACGVLGMFLGGTEDMWGMVDWEAGTCDFGTGLFARLLEAAKRFGDDGRKNVPELVEHEHYYMKTYRDSAMLEEEGLAEAGILYDDGYHATARDNFSLAVNANSTQKEGAWEFLSFLLGEEAQMEAFGDGGTYYPANRKAFKAVMAKELAKDRAEARPGIVWIGRYYNLTDERVEELEKIMENARFLPVKTTPILEIIYDEAQDYFDGIKSIDEITVLINNRVQLYLDELDM